MFTSAAAAAGGAVSSVDVTQLIQYGVLGLVLLLVIVRKYLVPEWTLKQAEELAARERADLERRLAESEAQLARFRQIFEEQMIPALLQATDTNKRYVSEMEHARFASGIRPADDGGSR
jgi:hypothetical protein